MANSKIQENQTTRIATLNFHKITSVSPLPNYELSVHFWDGVTKIYDIKPLFARLPVFNELKNPSLFFVVHVGDGGYGLIWNEDVDLSANEIWHHGRTVQTPFDDIISFADATEMWGLSESTLRKAVTYGKFIQGVDVCKYGKKWLISLSAMSRVYGAPRG